MSDMRDGGKKKKAGAGREKNPAAVALGRLGGMKGGKARADKLSPQMRTEIARKAASVRWGSLKQSATQLEDEEKLRRRTVILSPED